MYECELRDTKKQANIETAKRLLKSDMPIEEISKHKKLSLQEVKTLKKGLLGN